MTYGIIAGLVVIIALHVFYAVQARRAAVRHLDGAEPEEEKE